MKVGRNRIKREEEESRGQEGGKEQSYMYAYAHSTRMNMRQRYHDQK